VLRTLTTAARTHDITVVLTTHDPAVMLPKVTPGDPQAADAAGPTLADRNLTLVDGRLSGGLVSTGPGDGTSSGDDGNGGAGSEGMATGDSDPDDEDSKGAACSLSV
jgi:putative ABC transport system ATP-binding protein